MHGGLWSVWRGEEKHRMKEGERMKLALLEELISYITLRPKSILAYT